MRNHEYLPLVLRERQKSEGGNWHTCERPCPDCHFRHLETNGRGLYICNRCGFSDRHDDAKYLPLGKFERFVNKRFIFGRGT